MKIFHSQSDTSLLVVHPDNLKELSKLSKFPGLIKSGSYFFMPAEHRIAANLIQRLRRWFTVQCTPQVADLYSRKPALLELPDWFEFHTTPLPHQGVALQYAYTYRDIGLLLEPGLGKTKIILDWIWATQGLPALVICPLPLTFVWEDEAAIHRPELKPYVFKSTDFELEFSKAKAAGANLLVINYDKAVTLTPFLIRTGIKTLAIDEGLIKNPKSLRTQAILELSKKMPMLENKAIMSGTLITNGIADAFAPVQFIEPSLVGTAYGKFAEQYLESVYTGKKDSGGKSILAFGKDSKNDKAEQEVKAILEACSIIMTKQEWLKLPPKEVVDVEVDLPSEWVYYMDKLVRDYLITLPDGSEVSCEVPLTILSKWAQLGRGFCYIPDEPANSIYDLFSQGEVPSEPKKKKKSTSSETFIFSGENPFITRLIGLLTEELAREKTIIWFNLRTEGFLIEQALQKAGITYETIFGGEKSVRNKVHGFNRDASCQVLLCQSKAINYGVTVLGQEVKEDFDIELVPGFHPSVANEVFFSCNFSYELYTQQQDRIHRIGQTRTCRYWRLWGRDGFLDRKIREALDYKMKLNKRMLVDILETRRQELQNDIRKDLRAEARS